MIKLWKQHEVLWQKQFQQKHEQFLYFICFFLVTLKLLIAVIFYFFKKYGANQKHFIFHGVKIEFKKIDINSIL